jgi:small-conductance mechanosensitive channel
MKAFIVLLIAFWFSNLVSRKSKHYIDSSKTIKSSTKTIMTKMIDILVYTAIAIVLLKTFGVDFKTLALIGGAIGVGIGFGLQKIASNFISGIILLFEKSVEIGDVVELDNGNIFGTVKHFGGRYTLIEEIDGREIMVPNEELIISKVTNWTYSNNRAQVKIDFAVSYDSNFRLVKELAISAAKEHPRCLDYPEIECYARDFGESDMKFTLLFWISDITEGRQLPKSEVIMNLCDKFRENGIKIPYPQREIKVTENNISPKDYI